MSIRACALPFTVLAATLVAAEGVAQTSQTIRVQDVRALTTSAVQAADSLFGALDPSAAMERLEVRLEVAEDDFEARWRAAQYSLTLAILADDEDTRVAWLQRGNYHADRALRQEPDHPESLTWAAALKGRLAMEVGGNAEKARRGQEVWDLGHRLLAVDPDNAFGHDILGKLNQEVRKLGSIARFFARTFMGNDPIRNSTWESSEAHLKAAIESDPDVVLFHLDLGDTYFHQKKWDEARAIYEAGLRLSDRFPPDPKFKDEIRRQLAEIDR